MKKTGGSPRGKRAVYDADDPNGFTRDYKSPPVTVDLRYKSNAGKMDLRYPDKKPAVRAATRGTAKAPVRGTGRPEARRSGAKASAPRKGRYGALFALVIFAGIIVCVSAFALMIGSLSQNAAAKNPTPSPRPSGVAGIVETKREIRQTCLIKGLDASTRTFTLYGILDGRMFYAVSAGGTEMKDSYGNDLVFGEFKPGDVVDVSYYENDSVLRSIKQSGQALTFQGQQVTVDAANSKISRGSTTYIYGQELVCLYKGEPYDIEKVTPEDRVTLRVYQQVALFVEVTSGTGGINVIFNEDIRGGTIEIDRDIYSKLEGSKTFQTAEGSHRVIVKGTNIETFTRDVTVRYGETVDVNLADVQFIKGVVYFSSNVDGISMTVNDIEWDVKKALTLLYGTYNIKANAAGYEPFDKYFDLKTSMVNYPINMIPLPTPTPRPVREETAKLTIITSVGGADVYCDGQYVGRTSETGKLSLTFDARVGERLITISKQGYLTTELPLLISGDFSEVERTFNLQQEDSALPFYIP